MVQMVDESWEAPSSFCQRFVIVIDGKTDASGRRSLNGLGCAKFVF